MNSPVASQNFLHPEEPGNLEYWAAKWGVSVKQLNEAIVDTGKLNTREIKLHLRNKKLIKYSGHPWINNVMYKLWSGRIPKNLN